MSERTERGDIEDAMFFGEIEDAMFFGEMVEANSDDLAPETVEDSYARLYAESDFRDDDDTCQRQLDWRYVQALEWENFSVDRRLCFGNPDDECVYEDKLYFGPAGTTLTVTLYTPGEFETDSERLENCRVIIITSEELDDAILFMEAAVAANPRNRDLRYGFEFLIKRKRDQMLDPFFLDPHEENVALADPTNRIALYHVNHPRFGETPGMTPFLRSLVLATQGLEAELIADSVFVELVRGPILE